MWNLRYTKAEIPLKVRAISDLAWENAIRSGMIIWI